MTVFIHHLQLVDNSNFTMVDGRSLSILTMVYEPTNITRGAWISHRTCGTKRNGSELPRSGALRQERDLEEVG
jgi:hypothetical protein